MVKTCPRCAEEKPVDDFYRNKAAPDGLQSYCKECMYAYCRENYKKPSVRARTRARWRAYSKTPAGKAAQRRYHLKKKYNMTVEEYDRMMAAADGCEICGNGDKLVVDHNHATGEVRGPLCGNCNRAIGLMRDDPRTLRAAADYVEDHG